MKRRDLLLAGAAALAAPRIASAQAAKPLRFVPQADLAILDPVATPAFVTHNHGFMVFDTLYGVDSNFVARPQMVAGDEVDDDGKQWTLKLRPGLQIPRWRAGPRHGRGREPATAGASATPTASTCSPPSTRCPRRPTTPSCSG